MKRVVEAEWLDGLSADDPAALRSRRDLVRIDALLGCSGFLIHELTSRLRPPRSIVELGAGEGGLCGRLAARFPNAAITGCDLLERPASLDAAVDWCRGDLLETLPTVDAEAVVGSLILHHFSEEDLRGIGRHLRKSRLIVFFEPLRSRLAFALCRILFPFVSRVTRHDMPASIRAGFREGELSEALGLGCDWNLAESRGRFGSLRFVAWRR